jgi:F0F1-type ATP synthase membrane subunit c/vacuolar-type H+-ATPase subunit K
MKMNSKLKTIPAAAALLLASSPAFAQDGGGVGLGAGLGAGLAVGLAALGSGMGQGKLGGSALGPAYCVMKPCLPGASSRPDAAPRRPRGPVLRPTRSFAARSYSPPRRRRR